MTERGDEKTSIAARRALSAVAGFLQKNRATTSNVPWSLTALADELLAVEPEKPPHPNVLPITANFSKAVGRSTTRELSLFLTAVRELEPSAHWQQNNSYTDRLCTQKFLDNYGYFVLIGRKGFYSSNTLSLGFLLLGPNTHYPAHRHPAEELYIPLSGTAFWQQGEQPLTPQAPGSLIFHASEEVHTIETQSQPLLACYLWRGDLNSPARLC